MINGKRIDAVCVAFGDDIEVCWAPAYSGIYGGDQVKVEALERIEGTEEIGVVLFKDTITMGDTYHKAILEMYGEEPRRIMQRVDFTAMKWEGYEEVTNE